MRKSLVFVVIMLVAVAEAGLNMCKCTLSGNGQLILETGQTFEFTSARIMMATDGRGRYLYPFSVACKNGQDNLIFNYGYDFANGDDNSGSLVRLEDIPNTDDVWTLVFDRSYELRVARTNMEYVVAVISDLSGDLESPARKNKTPWPRSMDGLPMVYEDCRSTCCSFRAQTNRTDASCRSTGRKAISNNVALSNQSCHEMSREEIFATFLAKTNDCETSSSTIDRIRNISTAVYAENGCGRFIAAFNVFDGQSGDKVMSGICRGLVDEKDLSERELAIEGIATNGTEAVELYLKERAHEDFRSATLPWTIEIRYKRGGESHVLSTL